jgi:hypothetical protein
MSFKVKSPKVTAAPTLPTQPITAPVTDPQTSRARRLATGGRQSTFLGGLIRSALAAPGNSLTGVPRTGG